MSRERLVLTAASRPALARHVKLRFNETRKQWVILAPERLMSPSETAVDVLKLADGQRTIGAIADALAADFDAPADAILADILPLLQEMADQGYLTE
jgi:pyrroloquinoline quinone biosynthesis protein D